VERTDQRNIFRNRLIAAAVSLALVILLGSTGYYLLGMYAGHDWAVDDVVYFTIITLSTVGFSETLPGMETVPYARLLTVALIVFGSGTLLYFISTLTALIVEGDLQGAIRRNRMHKRIAQLERHYVVCGVGTTGIHIVEELINTGHKLVAIDRDEERLATLSEKYGNERFYYILGDATHDEVLIEAGIESAAGIIAALTDDKDNVFITLSAAQLMREKASAGTFRIVAKAVEPATKRKLIAAGAHCVVLPAQIGGMRMVSEMIRPAVVEFLDIMLRDPKKNLRIEEVEIPERSPLVGVKLGESEVRTQAKVLVIAVKYPETPPRYEYNPSSDLLLRAKMILIVLAEVSDFRKLREGIERGSIGRA
jgi:voltage-gated potassium channel